MQLSHTFIACYLELLCRHRGIVLEIGCGTAPLLRACLHSGRICVSIDSDDALITTCVLPNLASKKTQGEDVAGSSQVGDDYIDLLAGVAPYDDYVLPAYAEQIARKMAVQIMLTTKSPKKSSKDNAFTHRTTDKQVESKQHRIHDTMMRVGSISLS